MAVSLLPILPTSFVVDIDGVILDTMTEFLSIYNRKFNKQITKNEITRYDFSSLLGITKQQMGMIFQQCLHISTPIQITVEQLRALPAVIASKSDPRTYPKKLRRIFGSSQHDLLCVNVPSNKFKADVLNPVEYLALIDDNPEELMAWERKGGVSICWDAPWNRAFVFDYRIYKIEQINDQFKKRIKLRHKTLNHGAWFAK